jgi:hypothetical protein
MMCLWVSYKKKSIKKLFLFTSLKSLKKGVGSGSICQRYRSEDIDPDPKTVYKTVWYVHPKEQTPIGQYCKSRKMRVRVRAVVQYSTVHNEHPTTMSVSRVGSFINIYCVS